MMLDAQIRISQGTKFQRRNAIRNPASQENISKVTEHDAEEVATLEFRKVT